MNLTKLGFHKVAVGAKALLRGVQRENIIRMPGKLLPEILAGKAGAAELPDLIQKMPMGVSRTVAKDVERSRPASVKVMNNMGMSAEEANKFLDEAKARVAPLSGKTLVPRGVNPGEIVGDVLGEDFKRFKPRQKRLINAITLRHEGAESAIKNVNDKFFQQAMHRGPEVILKEHNQVRSLTGKGSKKVKELFTRGRTLGPEQSIISKGIPELGFEYGKSERLSRHAIRRISDSLNKKMNP